MTLAEWIATLPDDLRPRFEPMLDPENGLLGVQIADLFGLAPPEGAETADEQLRRQWAAAVLARQSQVLEVAAPMSMAVGAIYHNPRNETQIEPNLRRGIVAAGARWQTTGDPAYRTLQIAGMRQLARWLARLKRGADAASVYRELLALEPDNAMEWQNLGVIYKNQLGDEAEARRCFQKALDLDPESSHIARRELTALAPQKQKRGLLGRIFGGPPST